MNAPTLPIDPYLPAILDVVRRERRAVIVAPPGAGKTTRVPPVLADLGPTILLQPRRVAARALTRRIAQERGWTVGEEIGWQIRFERRFSSRTRLLVATEGVLTARLQSDPLLSDFRVVILDEFHERSIHADLALALVRHAAEARDDLAIVVMSATLDAGAVSRFLGNATIVEVEGRTFPIDVSYRPGTSPARAILEALPATAGDLLCFLPGQREIRDVQSELAVLGSSAAVFPLHGQLSVDEQERALAPSASRKVILATNIAETSLTVEGVTVVVDAGLQRLVRYDTGTGIDRLQTERISRDSANQRAGRAGRTQPGRTIRLWDERDQLREHREPEIQRVDLTAPLLDLIAWGGDPLTFDWFERPSDARMEAAMALLELLGAIEGRRLTKLGEQLRALPLHPRLARLLLAANGSPAAAAICAAISEGVRLQRANRGAATTDSDAFPLAEEAERLPAVRNVARELVQAARRVTGTTADTSEPELLRAILAGYPDRVAKRRDRNSPRLQLASGTGAVLSRDSGVHGAELLVALDVGAGDRGKHDEPMVRLASRIEAEWLIPTRREIVHTLDGGIVRAVRRDWYFGLLLAEESVKIDPAAASELLAIELARRIDAHLRRATDAANIALDEETASLVHRARFAGASVDWSAVATQAATGKSTIDAIYLHDFLDYATRQAIEAGAPASYSLPSGRSARLDYREDGTVVAAAKLQELFGLADTPRLGPQQTPITFELLAPNGRPVQITRDLRSFWNTTYADVRKELRGRYPKHPWPDDPWTATPTARAKRRM
jgi:ATP-dependent helicase HrpB